MISVLLIDSHSDTLTLYAEFLQFVGFHVHAVGTTDDACDIAPMADVIVTELRVRGRFDGLALIRWLRGQPELREVPIVVLTASPCASDTRAAADLGGVVCLSKPCLPSDLAAEIRHAAMGRRGRSAHSTSTSVDHHDRRPTRNSA